MPCCTINMVLVTSTVYFSFNCYKGIYIWLGRGTFLGYPFFAPLQNFAIPCMASSASKATTTGSSKKPAAAASITWDSDAALAQLTAWLACSSLFQVEAEADVVVAAAARPLAAPEATLTHGAARAASPPSLPAAPQASHHARKWKKALKNTFGSKCICKPYLKNPEPLKSDIL